MSQDRILISFFRFRDDQLQTLIGSVLQNLTDNPYFATPVPSVQEISAAYNNYTAALTAAQSRDRAKIAVKNQMRKELLDIMTSVVNYLNFTASGRRDWLASIGLPLSTESTSS